MGQLSMGLPSKGPQEQVSKGLDLVLKTYQASRNRWWSHPRPLHVGQEFVNWDLDL